MHDPEDSGKGFAPGENDEDEQSAATTHGSGRQFSKDVGDPEADERARQTEGSGRQFSPSVQDPEADADDEDGEGTGKQFEPGRHEL